MMRTRVIYIIFLLTLCAMPLRAQRHVEGVVLSADSLPLVGATITVEGTTMATLTDDGGRFSLSIPANATLTVSYRGYEPQTILRSSSDQSALQVVLQPANAADLNRPLHRTHRLAAWVIAGMISPLEAYSVQGKWWSYSCGGGGIGLGYQFSHRNLLLTTGLDVMSINYLRDYSIITDTPWNLRTNLVRLQVPVMIGMEMQYWYWQAGMKFGVLDYNIFELHNPSAEANNAPYERTVTRETTWVFSYAPSAEIGVSFARPLGMTYKLALTAEVPISPKMQSELGHWWMHTILGLKFTYTY